MEFALIASLIEMLDSHPVGGVLLVAVLTSFGYAIGRARKK